MAKKPKARGAETPPPGLSDNALGNVTDALNAILADSFALYIKTKNFHWHVSGPHFRDYHLLLDDQATQILGSTDLIAERVRKTGGPRCGRSATSHGGSGSTTMTRILCPPADMLAELRQDNLKLIESLREAKDIVDDAKDNATSGLIDTWTDEAERRAWFLLEAARTG